MPAAAASSPIGRRTGSIAPMTNPDGERPVRKPPVAEQISTAPIVVVAIDLAEGAEALADALRVTVRRILEIAPGARDVRLVLDAVLYIGIAVSQAFFVGQEGFVADLSQSEDGPAFVYHAAAVEIVFFKDLAAKFGTHHAELGGQFDKAFLVQTIFFFDLDGHIDSRNNNLRRYAIDGQTAYQIYRAT